jgi:hypothetical protein
MDMLQQCSSASSLCGHTLSRGALHWMSVFPSFYSEWLALCSCFLCFSVFFWHYCGPMLHKFYHQHSFPVQKTGADICINIFAFFSECVYPLLWLIFDFSIQKWNPGFITCYSYDVVQKFIAISGYHSKKIKAAIMFHILCMPMCIFGTRLVHNLLIA